MSTGPEYEPGKTTHAQLVERKAPPDNVIHLYHGTDSVSAEKIKAARPGLFCVPFHDFAMGRNTAFYLTTSHETAANFAKERLSTLDPASGTKAAVVSVTLRRDKVKIHEFDEVDPWKELVNYNRDKSRPKGKPQHPLVLANDVIAGWISTQSKINGRVPVAYPDSKGVNHFDWQYVIVTQKGLDTLEDIAVEILP